MKRSIVLFTLFSIAFLDAASLSHEEISIMVEKIKKERPGISAVVLESTPNPFAIIKKVKPKVPEKKIVEVIQEEPVVEEVVYELSAILNHAAFIAGKWYKVGDRLEPYTIHSIGKESIVLKNGNVKKTLSIPKREKKFILYKGN